jgi:hypothetical protein
MALQDARGEVEGADPGSASSGLGGGAEPEEPFERPRLIQRPNPAMMGSVAGPSCKEDAPRRGLSPFLLEMNKHLASAKQTKGSKLTAEEIQASRSDFKDDGLFFGRCPWYRGRQSKLTWVMNFGFASLDLESGETRGFQTPMWRIKIR